MTIMTGAVGTLKISLGAVDTNRLKDNAVTYGKMGLTAWHLYAPGGQTIITAACAVPARVIVGGCKGAGANVFGSYPSSLTVDTNATQSPIPDGVPFATSWTCEFSAAGGHSAWVLCALQ